MSFLELRHDVGSPLLLAMAAGLMGYGKWRAAEALFNPEGRGIGQHIDIAFIGPAYGWLAVDAIRFAFLNTNTADHHPARRLTGALISHPLGPVVLFVAGIIFAVDRDRGRTQCGEGRSERHLVAPIRLRAAIVWMSRIGMATRMTLVGLLGGSFLHAAMADHAHDAFDVSDALQQVTQVFGTVGLVLFGVGVMAYGGYLVALAEWRRLPI